ncbi:hypothetical protein N7470_002402 [Penicillium chermesinum]|nr:hypothetical protein N7470_002402 [Penicillium chermesinum]
MANAGQEGQPDYSTWSNSSLIERITELERQLHSQTTQFSAPADAETPRAPAPIACDGYEPAIPLPSAATNSLKKRVHSPATDITQTPAPAKPGRTKEAKEDRGFDPSKYSSRFIALKFAYLGQRYNGLEHTNGNVTPLPTVEEVLWKAMRRTRLIMPETMPPDAPDDMEPRAIRPYSISWDGCDYSKAGRTDRGVSAFGQVIGIRVRSARPKPKSTTASEQQGLQNQDEMQVDQSAVDQDWDDIADEHSYVQILNRVLPEDIRILAWCPHPPPGFDARFSCRERRYRYFFTQPAFSPTPGALGFENRRGDPNGPRAKYREGWLDIEAMREAAKHFEGEHDFRNFCKLDTTKQIENFRRMIFHSDIELVNPKTNPLGYVSGPGFRALEDAQDTDMTSLEPPPATTPQVYSFTLHGSAFLWHQVRHMVAILFLVGQGLEAPSIVPELLDVVKHPRKPAYDMASDAPLVLWDTIFPDESSGNREDALDWVCMQEIPASTRTKVPRGIRKIDEVLAGALLDMTVAQGDNSIIKEMESKQGAVKKHARGAKKATTDTVEARNARGLVTKQRKLAKKQDAEAKKAA